MTDENEPSGFAAVVPPIQSPGEQRAAELMAGNEAQVAVERARADEAAKKQQEAAESEAKRQAAAQAEAQAKLRVAQAAAEADAQKKRDAAEAEAKRVASLPFRHRVAASGWWVTKPEEPRSEDNPHMELAGNAKGGWIAQVHTGHVAHVFTVMADDLEAAKAAIMGLFTKKMKDDAAKKEADGAPGAA